MLTYCRLAFRHRSIASLSTDASDKRELRFSQTSAFRSRNYQSPIESPDFYRLNQKRKRKRLIALVCFTLFVGSSLYYR